MDSSMSIALKLSDFYQHQALINELLRDAMKALDRRMKGTSCESLDKVADEAIDAAMSGDTGRLIALIHCIG
jgi:hypothetical protein